MVYCLKSVTISRSLEELAREVARVQGQPAGKEEDSETSNETKPLDAPRSARRRHHRLRMLIDRLMCRDGKMEELLLERRAVKTLAARLIDQTAHGTFLKCVKERVFPLVEDVEFYSAPRAQKIALPTMVRSFLPVMDRWPSFSRSGSRKLPRFHRYLKERRQLTHPTSNASKTIAAQLTLLKHLDMAALMLILLVMYMRLSEFLEIKKKDLAPPLVPLLSGWSVVIAAAETGVSTKTRDRDGSVLMDVSLFQWVNMLLAMYQTRHSGASIDRVRGFRTLQKKATTKLVESFPQCYQIRHGLPLSPSHAPKQAGNICATFRVIVDKEIANPSAHKRMFGKYMPVFGGSGFLATASKQLDCVALCSTRSLVLSVT